MANQEHLEILNQGVEVWNKWREENPTIHPDLSNLDLSSVEYNNINFSKTNLRRSELWRAQLNGANMSKAQLWFADLKHANLNAVDFSRSHLFYADLSYTKTARALFRAADLVGTRFDGADLSKADFTDADLRGAIFIRSYLTNANFMGTTLSSTNFYGANLDGAMFKDAQLAFTAFNNIDLRKVIALDTVAHKGPSSVGIDTIFESNGEINESFLRECGVPGDLIEFIPSFISKPFQFHTCFISHSSNDGAFCDLLYADLRLKGVRCWYFPQDARWGRSVWGEIDQSIKIYDKLVVVCSKQSLQSWPVQREMERALQIEDTKGNHILFPIRIDDYLFDEWEHPRKADVISKVVGDFRNWEDPAIYHKNFDRLLRYLKASEE